MKLYCVTLGCAKNRIDTEMILSCFPKGTRVVDSAKGADLILINTCAFILSAKKESIGVILDCAASNPKAKLVVCGCLATRYLDDIKKEIPEIDRLVPIKDYNELPKILTELTGESFSPIRMQSRVLTTIPHTAYLKISEGCDNFCSFCAIPYIRGRFASRPFEEIIEEAKSLLSRDVREISIISQDTTVYGSDFPSKKPDIVDLLRALEGLGFYSIRLLYLYPSEISKELIDLIADSQVICHYFDIPIQSASDKLLRLMNRHGGKKEMEDLFAYIRHRCPDAVIRTTLIAGFPGENEKDVEETIDFLKKQRFDHMGCFAYSREEGTAAYSLPNQVDEKEKERRRDRLMECQAEISEQLNQARIGQVLEGMVIGKSDKGYLLSTVYNAPDDIDGGVYMDSPKMHEIGDIAKVRISSCGPYDLFGVEV